MALITGGTTATTSLSGLRFLPGTGSIPAADMALLNNSIKGDLSALHPQVPSAFTYTGLLHIPGNRGTIAVKPGDYVLVDSRGWPIVLSADTIASGPWTHT